MVTAKLEILWIKAEKVYDDGSPTDKDYMKAMAKPMCKDFLSSKEGKSGDTDYYGYKACCDILDLCKFYKQTWFFMVCGGAALFLVLIIIGVVFFVLWRKKKRTSSSQVKGYVGSAELF